MKKNKLNPLTIGISIVIAIVTFILSKVIAHMLLPNSSWTNLCQTLIFIVIGLPLTYFVGKYMGRRDKK